MLELDPFRLTIADHARDMDQLRTDSDHPISKLQVRMRFVVIWGLEWPTRVRWINSEPTPIDGSRSSRSGCALEFGDWDWGVEFREQGIWS